MPWNSYSMPWNSYTMPCIFNNEAPRRAMRLVSYNIKNQ